ncbi:hypothetical protein GQ600_18335 [Phytophthora cactorum]|nr:hypothetical protein GQ600_18335 [Phytophthora cactorum]
MVAPTLKFPRYARARALASEGRQSRGAPEEGDEKKAGKHTTPVMEIRPSKQGCAPPVSGDCGGQGGGDS